MNDFRHRVVIVEDEPKIRRNIAQKISESDEFEVVGTAADGMEGMNIIVEQKPSVVFTDIKMPKMGGLELIRRINEISPEIHFVIISGYNDFEYAQSAMKFGVRHYLLKPVSQEALYECMSSLSTSLRISHYQVVRELLTSSMNGVRRNADPSLIVHQRFSVFLICIGNLCPSVVSMEQYAFFSHMWSKLSFDTLMNRIVDQNEFWVVVDEKAPNQKLLLLSAGDMQPEDLSVLAVKIQTELALNFNDLPVHIGHIESFADWKGLGEQALKLRILLERELIPGQSSILSIANTHRGSLASNTSDQAISNKVSSYIQSGQTDLLKSELFHLFEEWEHAPYPQRRLEKSTGHLIRSIYLQTGVLSEAELHSLELELYAKLSVCRALSEFFNECWRVIEQMLWNGDQDRESFKLIEQVAHYLKMNYIQDINFEEVAARFHFSPSYLSKMFKKYYHEPPIKYVTNLRMAEAKKLFDEQPQLEVGKIAEIVGYTDQHYFSRIFKNTTGMSPSEYRSRHEAKDRMR